MSLANLRGQLVADMDEVPGLRESWATVEGWSEQSRYEIWTIDAATSMINAVGDGNKGLMQWLRKHW